ncbi:hypothetical protein RFI_01918 [Reticulomyxa filosa]|uniref:Uncharacterized protein n=1 Tax=Reticulomyxa filosa TaxID=46433 RepID=X6PAR1_RETFI|nr:hypothetical protein RFI_01918 [Reticulomyxa filosa]|eukprot:ETO35154.1 hypothetical protein RFI_01918 [Reticulomyxa filosa]
MRNRKFSPPNVLRKQEKGTNAKQKKFLLIRIFVVVSKDTHLPIRKKKHSKKKEIQNGLLIFYFFKKPDLVLKKGKDVFIELSDNEPVTFKPNGLSNDGKIVDEISKEENWKRLQQATKDGLKLTMCYPFFL